MRKCKKDKFLIKHKLILIVLSIIYYIFLNSALQAEYLDFDFGLTLFGIEELRLEREKNPSFNFALLKKYLVENYDNTVAQMSALHKFVNLLRLTDEEKSKELKNLLQKEVIGNFAKIFEDKSKNNGFENKVLLLELWLKGLLLATDKEADTNNTKDEEFENFIISIDDKLEKMHEYWLVKGLLFYLLKKRPNKYFAPMQPFEDFKNALARAPERDAHFFFVLGQAFRILGETERNLYLSIACFEKAASIVPANIRLQNTLLGIYMALHEHFQNMQKPQPFWLEEVVYKKILTLQPNNPYALNNLGYLYAEYGINRQTAVELCQRAVDIMPNNAAFRDSLGWALFKNQNYDRAEKELKQAIELNPTLFEPYYHLGTLYYVTKKLEKAVHYYEKAVQLKPNSAEVLNNYAYLLAELNQNLDKAYEYAQKAVNLEPSNPSYLDTLGWVYYRLGKLEEAKNYILKALKFAPNVGEIHYHLGKVYFDQLNFPEAIKYFKQAFQLDPQLENLEKEIYKTLTLKAAFDILADYHKTLQNKANPQNIKRILMNIANIYQSEGHYTEAINLIKLCDEISKNPLLLSQPLFSFYNFADVSTDTSKLDKSERSEKLKDNKQQITRESKVAQAKDEDIDILSKNELKELSKLGKIIINLGPSFFKLVSEFEKLQDTKFWHNLSLNLVLLNTNIYDPYSIFVTFYNRDFSGEEIYKKIENFLKLIGFQICECNSSKNATSSATLNQTNILYTSCLKLHNSRLVLAISKKHVILAYGKIPESLYNISLLEDKTFKYSSTTLMNIFVDLEDLLNSFSPVVSKLIRSLIPNNYELILSNYHMDENFKITEKSLIFMKNLENKFIDKLSKKASENSKILQNENIQNDVKIITTSNGIIIEASYDFSKFVNKIKKFMNSSYFRNIILPIINRIYDLFKAM